MFDNSTPTNSTRKHTALVINTTIAWCTQVLMGTVLAWNVVGMFVGGMLGRSAPGWAHPESGQMLAFFAAMAIVPVGLFVSLVTMLVFNHIELSGNAHDIIDRHPLLFRAPQQLAKAEALFVALVLLLFLTFG